MDPQRLAVRLMIFQAALFAAETAAIHQIGSQIPLMLIALIRGAAGVVLALVIARTCRLGVLKTRRPGLQLLRGGISLCYLWVMIYSFRHLPFADATAISYTQAAYIAAFSMLILGERVGWGRWAAAGLGIAGALLISKPALEGCNSIYLVALFGTGLNGLAFVLNRYLQRDDNEPTTMFYTNLVIALGNAPSLATAAMPLPGMLPWLSALLVLGPLGMYLGIVALRHASAAALGPYTLLRLVIGLAGGIVIFRELPDVLSMVGALVILASCVLSTHPGVLSRTVRAVRSRTRIFRMRLPMGEAETA